MTNTWRVVVAAAAIAVAGMGSAPSAGISGRQASAPAAADIVARSVAAHGGVALTAWKTLRITGTVAMPDGIVYTGAYTLLAKAPDRVKIEHDSTVDRGGRAFYEYYLNGGVAWTRRNLIPAAFDTARVQRWLDQCYGPARYVRPDVTLGPAAEGDIPWPPAPSAPSAAPAAPPSRRVWLIAATIGTETRELAIDQETARLLREVAGDTTRIYWDYAAFDGALLPTRILEITKARQGESRIPYTWKTVVHDAPIEDWRFTEDMPGKTVR